MLCAEDVGAVLGTATRVARAAGHAAIGVEEARLACDTHLMMQPPQREVSAPRWPGRLLGA